LTDPEAARRLEPFLGREATLSEAAKALHMTLPALLYHVNRLLALDLLEVACEAVRKGRAVKHDRTVADVFFVPFELTPSQTLGRLLFDLTESSERRFHREAAKALQTLSPTWGLYLTRGPNHRITTVLTSNTQRLHLRCFRDVFQPRVTRSLSERRRTAPRLRNGQSVSKGAARAV
jgi:hypothetical protein